MSLINFVSYRTFRQNCPFRVNLRVNEAGSALVVWSVSPDHNHTVSKVISLVYGNDSVSLRNAGAFQAFAQTKISLREIKENAKKLLELRANKN